MFDVELIRDPRLPEDTMILGNRKQTLCCAIGRYTDEIYPVYDDIVLIRYNDSNSANCHFRYWSTPCTGLWRYNYHAFEWYDDAEQPNTEKIIEAIRDKINLLKK